jgi:hypothetical protein
MKGDLYAVGPTNPAAAEPSLSPIATAKNPEFPAEKKIFVSASPLEGTRSADRACKWRAECVVDGDTYAAESRSGAPNELARRLIAAGVDPGRAVEIGYCGVAGHMSYRSLAGAARWTFEEGPSTPLRARAWKDPSERLAALGTKGILGGISPGLESVPVPSDLAHGNAVSPDTSRWSWKPEKAIRRASPSILDGMRHDIEVCAFDGA